MVLHLDEDLIREVANAGIVPRLGGVGDAAVEESVQQVRLRAERLDDYEGRSAAAAEILGLADTGDLAALRIFQGQLDEAQALLLRELSEARQEAGEQLEMLQRVAADFDNYRRRMTRDLAQASDRGAVEVLLFQQGKHLLGPFVDLLRHAGQAGHVNAVTLVGSAPHDSVQKHDFVIPFLDRDVPIGDPRQRLFQLGQFVVVGRE